jgi:glucoamylase
MKRSLFWINVLVLVTASSVYTAKADQYRTQYDRSIKGVLANILENGAIVASPSRADPDYYYDWVRDTALTMKMLVQLGADASTPAAIRKTIAKKVNGWIDFELARQQTPTLTGLGEPKFYVNGKANLDPWGRPQNDGPALRAITAIEVANQMIQEGQFNEVRAKLYRAEIPANTLIKRDLEYVAHHWFETSFDLWEEERAMHFYTLTVQKVALLKGARLALTLNDTEAAKYYNEQANNLGNYLASFVDSNGIVRYALNKSPGMAHKTGDLDIAVILAAIHTFDGQFYVPVKYLIKTADAIVAEAKKIYTVNKTTRANGMDLGVALGRYRDDKYSGFNFSEGNPWFLATLALAEFSCNLVNARHTTALEMKSFNATAIKQFNRVLFHMSDKGSFSEQFNRENGFMQGARDLTWSYASYVTAYRACFKP